MNLFPEKLTIFQDHSRLTVGIVLRNQDDEIINFNNQKVEPWSDPPAIHINHDAAQKLVDDLIKCGFKPTVPVTTDIKNHLEDMRKLTFHLLKVK